MKKIIFLSIYLLAFASFSLSFIAFRGEANTNLTPTEWICYNGACAYNFVQNVLTNSYPVYSNSLHNTTNTPPTTTSPTNTPPTTTSPTNTPPTTTSPTNTPPTTTSPTNTPPTTTSPGNRID